jgi:hypothetical protein
MHIGLAPSYSYALKYTPELVIKLMDKVGIDKAVVMPLNYLQDYDFEGFKKSNDYVAKVVKQYSDRLVGFCVVHPRYKERAVKEVERSIKELGLAGVGEMHAWAQTFSYDEPIANPIVKACIELDVPILFHVDFSVKFCTPYRLANLAKRNHKAKIVMAHWGFDSERIAELPDIMAQVQNMYIDTSNIASDNVNLIRQIIRKIGVNRVLFGSDGPGHHPQLAFTRIKLANLSEDEERMIFEENAKRLLKL